MKKRSPVVRISPLMLALLSLGIGPPQSLRAIRISNSEAVAASAPIDPSAPTLSIGSNQRSREQMSSSNRTAEGS